MTEATRIRIGWLLSAVVATVLLADGATALFAPQMLAEPMRQTGFAQSAAIPIGIAALIAALLYALPQTAVLGAILMTGFLGGAICTHLRIGEIGSSEQLVCLALGIAAWAGLWLRDARLRALLPVRDRQDVPREDAYAALSMPSSPSLR